MQGGGSTQFLEELDGSPKILKGDYYALVVTLKDVVNLAVTKLL